MNDKYSMYPSKGLTPQRLARIFRQADDGDVREQMELFEEMEEKDTSFSQMQTKKTYRDRTGLGSTPFFDDYGRDKRRLQEVITEQLKGSENRMMSLWIYWMPCSRESVSWRSGGGWRQGANVILGMNVYIQKKLSTWDCRNR